MWNRRQVIVLYIYGCIGGFFLGFSAAMLLVGSGRWGDYWICVANFATCP